MNSCGLRCTAGSSIAENVSTRSCPDTCTCSCSCVTMSVNMDMHIDVKCLLASALGICIWFFCCICFYASVYKRIVLCCAYFFLSMRPSPSTYPSACSCVRLSLLFLFSVLFALFVVCLPACLPVCLPGCLLACLPDFPVGLLVWHSFRLSVFLRVISVSVSLSVNQLVCLPISGSLYACLSAMRLYLYMTVYKWLHFGLVNNF